jgi:hypothetical protein
VTLLGAILHPGIVKDANKQTNIQTTIMTCVFGLESWLGILNWDLGQVHQMLQDYVVFNALELSMVLLGPWYILQTVLIGLHALVRIHTLCCLVCSLAKVTVEVVNHLT